jgi:hypothetical protein
LDDGLKGLKTEAKKLIIYGIIVAMKMLLRRLVLRVFLLPLGFLQ